MIRCGAAVLWIACTMQVVVTCSGCGGTGQVPPALPVRQAMIEDFHLKPVAMSISYSGSIRAFPPRALIWYSTEDGRRMAPAPLAPRRAGPPDSPEDWFDPGREVEKVDQEVLDRAFAAAIELQEGQYIWGRSLFCFWGENGRSQRCCIGEEGMYLFYRRLVPFVPADSYLRKYVLRFYSMFALPYDKTERLLSGEATLDELRGR